MNRGMLLGLIALGALSSCGRRVDGKKAEKLMKDFLEKQLPGRTATVTCPENIKPKEGETFECKAEVDGKPLTLTVTQTDSQGTVSWEVTDGLVALTIKEEAQNLISKYIETSLGKPGAQVECPKDIEVGQGKTFECSSMVEGVKVTAEVTQQDDKGNVNYRLRGAVLSSEKLAVLIQGDLKSRKIEAQVDCGQPLRLSKPGDTFECRAMDANGQQATIAVLIKDDAGNVDWNLQVPENK